MRFRFPYFQSSNSIFLGPAIGARLIQSATHPLTCPPREPSYGHMRLSTRLGSPRIRRRPTRNAMQPHALAHRDQGVGGGLTDILKDAPTYAYAQRGNQAKLAKQQRSKHEKGFHAIHCLEPGCGQSEIRTRGRLPFNGFQDRLFRPLRHLSNMHNARNVNIAQHSEIIRIATRKSASSVAKGRPTIPKPTQHNPNAAVRKYPTNPSIPKTTQHGPNA